MTLDVYACGDSLQVIVLLNYQTSMKNLWTPQSSSNFCYTLSQVRFGSTNKYWESDLDKTANAKAHNHRKNRSEYD